MSDITHHPSRKAFHSPYSSKSEHHKPDPQPSQTSKMTRSSFKICKLSESFDDSRSIATTVSSSDLSAMGLQCVAFDLESVVHEIPALSEFSNEEVAATWYGPMEKMAMQEEAFSAACDAAIGCCEEARGLEAYTFDGARQRKLNRIKHLIAVLREQQRQKESGKEITSGPELIAAACRDLSIKSQERAYIQGAQDEEDACPQKPRSELPPPQKKLRGLFSGVTQVFKDISDIAHVKWAAQ
jgi:hypothetical protein